MKKSSISDIENGRRSLTEQTRMLICREFNIDEHWLCTGEGEMLKPNPTDTLSKFIQERGLSTIDRALIEKFATLDATSRQAVVDYVLSIADTIMKLELPPSVVPPVIDPNDEDAALKAAARKKADAYYEQLLLEASARTSGASTPAKAG